MQRNYEYPVHPSLCKKKNALLVDAGIGDYVTGRIGKDSGEVEIDHEELKVLIEPTQKFIGVVVDVGKQYDFEHGKILHALIYSDKGELSIPITQGGIEVLISKKKREKVKKTLKEYWKVKKNCTSRSQRIYSWCEKKGLL